MTSIRWTRLAAAAILAAPVILLPVVALARAGGGQNYGGGSGGGGFGGGGGDGMWMFWLIPLLSQGHGVSGLVVFLVLLYVFRQLRSRRGAWGGWGAGEILNGGTAPQPGIPATQVLDVPTHHYDADAVNEGIAAIKAKDSNFEEHAFLDRAQTSFFKVQQAWTARDQDLARDCMSDALYERHKMQTDQLMANHQIDILDNIVIGSARIVQASAAGAYDAIKVAFTASMTDYTIDEATRRVVDGSQFQQTFTEYWTFIRRGDAKSTAGQTTLKVTCAGCGAPLQLKAGKCVYCGSFARTSSSDWVVDTIEQP